MNSDHEKHNAEAEQAIIENVEKYGCHLALFEADNYLPAFAYTIGLYKTFQHPEIICFGLPPQIIGNLLNHARDLIKEGEKLIPGKSYSGFLDEYAVQFLPVEKDFYPDYLGYAGWFYKNNFDFPSLQLVWPDKEHKFPWEPEFKAEWKFMQPLLDRNTDFKFYEERNLGVYTTKQVLEGAPILYVYHNEDGNWQFHSSPNPKIEDGKVVALETITRMDPSVNDIFFLEYGTKAFRKEEKSGWITEIL